MAPTPNTMTALVQHDHGLDEIEIRKRLPTRAYLMKGSVFSLLPTAPVHRKHLQTVSQTTEESACSRPPIQWAVA